ncbi:hypothetical protein [Chryseobacterium sp.]|nr:hypothetical protein [Chryseobacterium sp.]
MKSQTKKRSVLKEKGHQIFQKMGRQISLKTIQQGVYELKIL